MKVLIDILDNDYLYDKIYNILNSNLVMYNFQRYSKRLTELKNKYGIYILFGPLNQKRQIYIGLTKNLYSRIMSHRREKEFWCECLCFTLSNGTFSKSQIEWLERECIKAVIESNNFDIIKNYLIPDNVILNSLELNLMQSYFNEIKLLLNIFNAPIIKRNYIHDSSTLNSKLIINRIVQSYRNTAFDENDYYFVDDDENSFHIIHDNVSANGMIMPNQSVYISADSIISDNLDDYKRVKLLSKYKDKIHNFTLSKAIIVDNFDIALKIIG